MRKKVFLNSALGIGTELLYATSIVLVAFLISLALSR